MTLSNHKNLTHAVDTLQASANKVEDGINNVLEPEIKDARISSYDTNRLVQGLYQKVLILFSISIAINAATLIYILNM